MAMDTKDLQAEISILLDEMEGGGAEPVGQEGENVQPVNGGDQAVDHRDAARIDRRHPASGANVTEKVKYGKPGNERYAFRGKTADGRNLTKFVKKADWEKANV